MESIQINKKFASLEECDKWEEENFPNRTYKGKNILMVNHVEQVGSPEVLLESVMVI